MRERRFMTVATFQRFRGSSISSNPKLHKSPLMPATRTMIECAMMNDNEYSQFELNK